jgi:ribonuclease HI
LIELPTAGEDRFDWRPGILLTSYAMVNMFQFTGWPTKAIRFFYVPVGCGAMPTLYFCPMAKQKYYVVWEGHKPGVYKTWDECKKQVDGFPQAKYKSFDSAAEAALAFKGNYWAFVKSAAAVPKATAGKISRTNIVQESVAVDAACSGNPGDMEYRGVWMADGRQLFHVGPLHDGTNNIGEFLAIVHALALLKTQGKPNMVIYSDSKTAQGWVKKGHCNTKLEATKRNSPIFELIDRAEKWLAVNKVTNPIVKWETEDWGEIPADFGRK